MLSEAYLEAATLFHSSNLECLIVNLYACAYPLNFTPNCTHHMNIMSEIRCRCFKAVVLARLQQPKDRRQKSENHIYA